MAMSSRVLWGWAIGCGGVAGALTWWWFQGWEVKVRDHTGDVPVVVTGRDLAQGTWITPDTVQLRWIPKPYVQPGTIGALPELTNAQGKPVYAAAVPMGRGEHLTLSKLIALGRRRGLASLLPRGKVAVSLALTPARGAGGWVRAGDHVDLFCTLDSEGLGPLESVTVPLLQDVPVLAVGDRLIGDAEEPKSSSPSESLIPLTDQESSLLLTIAVEPGEVGKVVLARDKGLLSLVLRAVGETSLLPPSPVWLSVLAPVGAPLARAQRSTPPIRWDQRGSPTVPSLERELRRALEPLP